CFSESGSETHSWNVCECRPRSASGKTTRYSRGRRFAIRNAAGGFRESKRRLSRTARGRTRCPKRRRLHRFEGIERGRGNRHVGQFPCRFGKSASGGAWFVRAATSRRGFRGRDKCIASEH